MVVLVMLTAFAINLLFASPEDLDRDRAVLRYGAAVFGVFVLNEHLHMIRGPLAREPFGFLVFVGAIAFVVMRRAVSDRARVTDVDTELATARKIQLASLPKALPARSDFDVAVRYLPASEVAGDYYHFLELDAHRLGIFIADVSGHGVPAALVASMLKTAVAANAAKGDSPAALLHELNLLFCGNLERQFITAFYACLDSATQRITYASAGHPAPLHRRADGRVEELRGEGTVLGRFRHARFIEQTLPFEREDLFLFYTDGVSEATDRNGAQWGEASLQSEVSRMNGAKADEVVGRIVTAVNLFAARNDRHEDDVTLVAVRC
jgi:sigma-B regulation protein RsbU (phosphoserine phosphatase)